MVRVLTCSVSETRTIHQNEQRWSLESLKDIAINMTLLHYNWVSRSWQGTIWQGVSMCPASPPTASMLARFRLPAWSSFHAWLLRLRTGYDFAPERLPAPDPVLHVSGPVRRGAVAGAAWVWRDVRSVSFSSSFSCSQGNSWKAEIRARERKRLWMI